MLTRRWATALAALVVVVTSVAAAVGVVALLEEDRAEGVDDFATREPSSALLNSNLPATKPGEIAASSQATTLCVDSTLAGATTRLLASIARIQPSLADTHKLVGEGYRAAGGDSWAPYREIQPASGCPHGTPKLTLPTDGRLLRDTTVRPPVDSPSAYQLKLFVLPDDEADALFPGKDYLRMPYEQLCNEKGWSCATMSVALFVAERNAADDRVVFDAIVDGLGFRQALVYPNGHPASEDGVSKPPK